MCEECGERPATVHVARIANGQQSERHLCAQCAMETGEIGPLMQSPAWLMEQFLSALGGVGGQAQRSPRTHTGGTVAIPENCPRCGLSFGEFRRTGMLGCPTCYESFRPVLAPAVRRIHGASAQPGGGARRAMPGEERAAQNGTRPAPPEGGQPEQARRNVPHQAGESRADRLRAQLNQAVQEERYEDAARLRDEIRALAKG